MKPQDLRIGNYILFNEVCRVYEIQENCFYVMGKDEISYKNITYDLKPISITQKILLDSGFIKQGNRNFYVNGIIGIIINHGFEIWIKDASGVFYRYTLKIQYVHQLQNLYFTLTGEELKINL